MSITDKAKNKAEELAGKAKQGVGEATGNDRLFAEGQAQETAAHAKQAGEHVKDAGRDVRDAFS
ncbi:CsbD family protein [Actinoplanes aureus]|uniref:CsbD family protein n=1 Tax=Actinoplanes aureus TaxID=2792083 RepID=A0A931FWH1_9ACTN|nr:CsbD family protein [Actinoplanes aureus]MBG0562438.1 CsbD family protein [Actinoplanes aureus]